VAGSAGVLAGLLPQYGKFSTKLTLFASPLAINLCVPPRTANAAYFCALERLEGRGSGQVNLIAVQINRKSAMALLISLGFDRLNTSIKNEVG